MRVLRARPNQFVASYAHGVDDDGDDHNHHHTQLETFSCTTRLTRSADASYIIYDSIYTIRAVGAMLPGTIVFVNAFVCVCVRLDRGCCL